MRMTPTASHIENVLEISSLFILLLNFIVSSFTIDSRLQLAQVPALLAVTNTTYIAILLVYILSVQFALLKGFLRKLAQKFNVSLFRKPSNRLGRDAVNLNETSKDQLLDTIIALNEEIEEMKRDMKEMRNQLNFFEQSVNYDNTSEQVPLITGKRKTSLS